MRPLFYRTLIVVVLVVAYVPALFSQADSSSAKGNLYFMRNTGYVGSLQGFTIFMDSVYLCKLNEKRYSVHNVAPGIHTFSVQFAGKQSKKKAEKVEIEIISGETYYIQTILQTGVFANNVLCQEVTRNSAKLLLPKLKLDPSCGEEATKATGN